METQQTLLDPSEYRPSLTFARGYFARVNGLRCIEVGVQRGDNSERIRQALNPAVLVLIDNWEHEDLYANQGKNYHYVLERFSEIPEVLVVKDDSSYALSRLAKGSFDYIYVDADHEVEKSEVDFRHSLNLIKKGGIIAGHDYDDGKGEGICRRFDSGSGVTRAAQTVFDGQYMWFNQGDFWVII